jgi:CRISPR system Cascade subunit CasE
MEVIMYLSKIFISWRKARNPYDIHRELWKLFPSRPDSNRDFLFRLERQQKGLGADILMQSMQIPIKADSTCQTTANREYNLSLKKGQRLRFRLRANPTKKILDQKERTNKKGEIKKCRVPLIREQEQRDWLERKLANKCYLDALTIHREVPLYFRKFKEQRSGKILTVLFDGILGVECPNAFVDMVKTGIGPAKAFGCGLLSLARI